MLIDYKICFYAHILIKILNLTIIFLFFIFLLNKLKKLCKFYAFMFYPKSSHLSLLT